MDLPSGFDSSFPYDSNPFNPSTVKPWQARPPYIIGKEIQYNNGTVFYVRRSPGVILVPFFTAYWWLAILILLVVVVVLYAILCVWICCHFERSEQRRAKKVVEAAYVENGFFDLDAYCEETGLQIKRTTSTRSVEGAAASDSTRHRSAPGNPYVKRGSDSDFEMPSLHGSQRGSPIDERTFVEDDLEEEHDSDNVAGASFYGNVFSNNSRESSDEDALYMSSTTETSSSENTRGAYRMPLGRRRSQNPFDRN